MGNAQNRFQNGNAAMGVSGERQEIRIRKQDDNIKKRVISNEVRGEIFYDLQIYFVRCIRFLSPLQASTLE